MKIHVLEEYFIMMEGKVSLLSHLNIYCSCFIGSFLWKKQKESNLMPHLQTLDNKDHIGKSLEMSLVPKMISKC